MTGSDRRRVECDGGSPNGPRVDFGAANELTEIFETLANARRRRVVYFLAENEDAAVSIEQVAEYVCRVEPARDAPESRRREEITADLHHTHLPRLAGAGMIDYDRRTKAVRYVGRPSFDEWVDLALRAERPE